MENELAEKIDGLGSAVAGLIARHRGGDTKTLMELQDEISQLSLAVIARDLRTEQASYTAAIQGLNAAIDSIGNTANQLDDVAKGIALASKAISLVTKALGAV